MASSISYSKGRVPGSRAVVEWTPSVINAMHLDAGGSVQPATLVLATPPHRRQSRKTPGTVPEISLNS
jgi:hypothetical protein